jgi:phage terminase Nu1 subunit (DNA packaging protein)
MAECNPWDKASQQHMALRQQADSEHPIVLVHQPQIALVAIQDLERQRLALAQHQNQQLENQRDSQKQTQTLCLTEDN